MVLNDSVFQNKYIFWGIERFTWPHLKHPDPDPRPPEKERNYLFTWENVYIEIGWLDVTSL